MSQGMIFNIQRFSIYDGPGARTTVFFKGCNLKCKWCHNPESISAKRQLEFYPDKCIGCGKCFKVCPQGAHILTEDGTHIIDREKCTVCGTCVDTCFAEGLVTVGQTVDADYVVRAVMTDVAYYEQSGGGVTFSGGECLLHTEFLTRLAEKCHKVGIHTAVESAFHVPWEKVAPLIPHIDLFFGDLKIPDPEKHRRYTGRSNDRILENLRRLSREADNIILRIPVIPGVNDSREDLEGFARIIRTFGNGVKEVELLKYNPLAKSKYTFLDEEYTAFSQESQTDSRMRELCDLLQEQCGLRCYFV